MTLVGNATVARETIILVHGTFSAPQKVGALQWHEHGSAVANPRDEELARLGSPARCWAHAANKERGSGDFFSWTGENHWMDRESAASALAAHLDELVGSGWRCHIVAHSHGGNVVVDALRRMKVSTDPGYADAWGSGSIVTMGTPFLGSSSWRHPFVPEMNDADPGDGEFLDLYLPVIKRALVSIAVFFAVLAFGLTLAGIDLFTLRLALTSAAFLTVTIPVAVVVGVIILAARIANAKLIGAASFSRGGRMLVLTSEHDEAWQLLSGLLASKPHRQGDSVNSAKSRAVFRGALTLLKRAGKLVSNTDLLAYPGRSYVADGLLWGSAAVLLATAARYPTTVSPFLPYIGALYVGFLVAGFIGTNYMMRACVRAPIRAVRALVLCSNYLTGASVAALVQRKAIPFLKMKAAGLDYFPDVWPSVSRRPKFIDPMFYQFNEIADQEMLDTRTRRDASVANAIGLILGTVERYGIEGEELDALLANIARNTTLCHAAYYMNPKCISMIARWIARTEKEIWDEEQKM